MSFADLSFDRWRTLDLATATRHAQEIALHVTGRVIEVETVEQGECGVVGDQPRRW